MNFTSRPFLTCQLTFSLPGNTSCRHELNYCGNKLSDMMSKSWIMFLDRVQEGYTSLCITLCPWLQCLLLLIDPTTDSTNGFRRSSHCPHKGFCAANSGFKVHETLSHVTHVCKKLAELLRRPYRSIALIMAACLAWNPTWCMAVSILHCFEVNLAIRTRTCCSSNTSFLTQNPSSKLLH